MAASLSGLIRTPRLWPITLARILRRRERQPGQERHGRARDLSTGHWWHWPVGVGGGPVHCALHSVLRHRRDARRPFRQASARGDLQTRRAGAHACGSRGLSTASVPALLAVLFGLGIQAALFGPVKYGVLPEYLAAEELIAGNGIIEATTFLSIVCGTVAGGLLILLPAGTAAVGAAGIALSLLGLFAALRMPWCRRPTPP